VPQTAGLFDHFLGAQLTIPDPALAGRGRLDWEAQDASAALSGLDVAGGDLVFVGGKGCQDFGLLALRHLDEVQGPSEFVRSKLTTFVRRRTQGLSTDIPHR
jgi:hypothetical protein